MKQILTILFSFSILINIFGQTPEPVILEVKEVEIAGTDEISCHLFCSNFEQIAGFGFTIVWDTMELQYIKIDSFGPSGIFNPSCIFGNFMPGTIPALWSQPDENCIDLEDGTHVVSIRFKRLNGTGKFKIANSPIPIEFINCDNQLLEVIFIDNFGGITNVRNGIILNILTLESEKISIFPNPASDKIFFKWDQLRQLPEQALIYNLYGQMIGQSTITDQSIDLPESILPGTYLLMLQKDGETVAVKKIQVQK